MRIFEMSADQPQSPRISVRQQIRADRRQLQNPYAHIEQLEELQVARSYQNPYFYATQPFASDNTHRTSRKVYRTSEIEQRAVDLQRDIWKKRGELGIPANARAIDVLQPKYAAQVVGYDYFERPSLGWITQGRSPIVCAGMVDNRKRIIEVATDVSPRVMRFTSAHEIGHAVLHPQLTGLHRDRPLNGSREQRDRIEYEADKFSAFFLMPRKLVTEQFLLRFIIAPFTLDEQTAFALSDKSYSSTLRLFPTRRHLSRTLASTTRFNGRHIVSLTEYFGMSVEAMAIRLEELRLIAG